MADKAKPLKKKHPRLALRDPRLQSKAKPKTRAWPSLRRKAVMAEEEARRLFSETMRTRNRNLRDLLPDPQQLRRYGLPRWQTEEDVANALGVARPPTAGASPAAR